MWNGGLVVKSTSEKDVIKDSLMTDTAMRDQANRTKLSTAGDFGRNVISTYFSRTSNESDAPTDQSDAPTSTTGSAAMTRRSYLVAATGAATLAAVPAASAASGNDYGQGEYGMETYGGVSS